MQSLLKTIFEESQRHILLTVIAQINMLICLLSDIRDFNLIDRGLFQIRVESFDPMKTFKFIVRMFASHAKIHDTELKFRVLAPPLTPSTQLGLFTGN